MVDGYCADTPAYDLSGVGVPVRAQYVDGDTQCPVDVNRAIMVEQVSTLISDNVWTDGRESTGADALIGNNDETYVNYLLFLLDAEGDVDATDPDVCAGSAIWA